MSVSEAPFFGVLVDEQNPWPGLVSFTEEASDYFRGRNEERAELFRLVTRETLSVVFGSSGLGKTSLLQAGLFPELRRADFLPVYVRLKHGREYPPLAEQVLTAVGEAALRVKARAPQLRPQDTLWEYFQRRDGDVVGRNGQILTPVLVIDQFEEIFTLGRQDAERTDDFMAEFECLIENHAPPRVEARLVQAPEEMDHYDFDRRSFKAVVALREDFVPELENFRLRLRGLAQNRFRLQRMNGRQALAVALEAGHGLITEEVARRVVESLGSGDSEEAGDLERRTVEPALLSVVLRELNLRRQRQGQAQITPDMVTVAHDILSDFYASNVADLDPRERAAVEDGVLSDSGRYRVQAAVDDLMDRGISRAWLDRLVDRRILRYDKRYGARVVELTHDRLVPVVQASREDRMQREAADTQRRNEEEMRRKLWRSRRFTVGFAILAGMAVVGMAVAFHYSEQAVAERRTAEQQTVLATAAQRKSQETAGALQKSRDSELDQRQRAEVSAIEARQAEDRALISLKEAEQSKQSAEALLDWAIDSIEDLSTGSLRQSRDEMRVPYDVLSKQITSTENTFKGLPANASVSIKYTEFEQRCVGFLTLAAETCFRYGEIKQGVKLAAEAKQRAERTVRWNELSEDDRSWRAAEINYVTGLGQLLKGELPLAERSLQEAASFLSGLLVARERNRDREDEFHELVRLHVMIELARAEVCHGRLRGLEAIALGEALLLRMSQFEDEAGGAGESEYKEGYAENKRRGRVSQMQALKAYVGSRLGEWRADYQPHQVDMDLLQAYRGLDMVVKRNPENNWLKQLLAEVWLAHANANLIKAAYPEAFDSLERVQSLVQSLQDSGLDIPAWRLLKARTDMLKALALTEQYSLERARFDLVRAEAEAAALVARQPEYFAATVLRWRTMALLQSEAGVVENRSPIVELGKLPKLAGEVSYAQLHWLEAWRHQVVQGPGHSDAVTAVRELKQINRAAQVLRTQAPHCVSVQALAGRVAYDQAEIELRIADAQGARPKAGEDYGKFLEVVSQGGQGALVTLETARVIAQENSRRWPMSEWQHRLALAALRKAELHLRQGDSQEALRLAKEAAEAGEAGRQAEIGNKKLNRGLIDSYRMLARLHLAGGELTEMMTVYGKAVEVAVELRLRDPQDAEYRVGVAELTADGTALLEQLSQRTALPAALSAELQHQLTTLEDAEEFNLPPMLRGRWERVSWVEQPLELQRFVAWAGQAPETAAVHGFFDRLQRGEFEPGRMRKLRLNFFTDAELFEVSIRRDGAVVGTLAYVAYGNKSTRGFVHLNGDIEVVQKLNERAGLIFTSAGQVEDYFRLFSGAVSDQSGVFDLVEKPQDLRLFGPARTLDRAPLPAGSIKRVQAIYQADRSWLLLATVAYGGRLMEVTYTIKPDGGLQYTSNRLLDSMIPQVPVAYNDNGLRVTAPLAGPRATWLVGRELWTSAEVLLQAGQADGTLDSVGYWQLSYCHLFLGDYARALAVAEEGLERSRLDERVAAKPVRQALQLNRAHALLFLGRREKAREIYFSPENWDRMASAEGGLWREVALEQLQKLKDVRRYQADDMEAIRNSLLADGDPF